MYGIIEIKEEDHSKKMVAFVDTSDQFIPIVKSQISDEYTTIEKLSFQDFSKNKSFKQGRYLLINNVIILLEKAEIIRKGYLYNTILQHVNIIKTWELIPIKCDLPQVNNNVPVQNNANNVFIPNKKIVEKQFQNTNLITDHNENTEIDKLLDEVFSDHGTYDEYDALHTYERINPSDLEDYTSMLIIGPKGSGKSTIVSNILNKYDETFIYNSLIISRNEKFTKYYQTKYPYTRIEAEYKPEYIDQLLSMGSGAIILDDCLKPNEINNDICLTELIHHAKYYNKMVIITMSFSAYIDSDTRKAFDYVFLMEDNSVQTQKRIYEQYCNMYETFDNFRNDFINLTKNHNSMVINQNYGKNNNDQVSWFNAVYDYTKVFKMKLD